MNLVFTFITVTVEINPQFPSPTIPTLPVTSPPQRNPYNVSATMTVINISAAMTAINISATVTVISNKFSRIV